ncbi:MAG: hypothetical protein QOH31_2458 [Verrucomicrobiota bacterium]
MNNCPKLQSRESFWYHRWKFNQSANTGNGTTDDRARHHFKARRANSARRPQTKPRDRSVQHRPEPAPHRARRRHLHDPALGDDTDGRYCLIGMDITLGGGPPPIGMISRSPSPSSKARSKPLSAAKSRSCAPARPSTSQPTHRTPSPTLSSKRCGCCASACRPGRKSSSCRSVSLWRPT